MNAALWFYLAVTVAAIIWLAWHYALAVESRRWPRTKAKVIRAWVERTDSEYAYYSPRVEYTFKVSGVPHRSTTIWLMGDKSMRKGRAELMASGYHPGDEVDVWYDPTKPERSTLMPGRARGVLAALIAVSVIGPLLAVAFTDRGRQFFEAIGIHIE